MYCTLFGDSILIMVLKSTSKMHNSEIARNYMNHTTVHGCRYCVEPSLKLVEKTLWFLVVCIFFVFGINIIWVSRVANLIQPLTFVDACVAFFPWLFSTVVILAFFAKLFLESYWRLIFLSARVAQSFLVDNLAKSQYSISRKKAINSAVGHATVRYWKEVFY